MIEEKASAVLNKNVSINFITQNTSTNLNNTHSINNDGIIKNSANNLYNSVDYGLSTLNPKYVFETFVVGNSNRFAHAASF